MVGMKKKDIDKEKYPEINLKTEMSIFVLHTHIFFQVYPQVDWQAKDNLTSLG